MPHRARTKGKSFRADCGYAEPNAIGHANQLRKVFSRSHDAAIRVYDEAGNVTETHEHTGDFKEC
jgi:hypothetical protein